MAIDSATLLLAIGLSLLCAYLASLGFRFLKIPDIIFLIAFGVLIGPVTHLVPVALFRDISSLVGTVAIIIILFEGGLKIQKAELMAGVAQGALLALVVFVATTLLSALVAVMVAGITGANALMLGMAMGGAGVVIVIPLIQQMGVEQKTRTLVSIEAAVSDVLVVLGVVGVATALASPHANPADFVRDLLQNFAIGIALGAGAGLLWVQALRAFKERSYEYVLTIAALFILYAATEALHGSGPLAILIFGLVLGNSRKTRRLAEDLVLQPKAKPGRTWERVPVFGGELANLHHEVVFFIRTFFFVTLGVVLDLSLFRQPKFILVGALLALAVAAGRWWGVRAVFWGKRKLPPWDLTALSLMFPLGLAAAVLSLVPHTRFQLEGTQQFGSYAAMAIVLTNLAAAILVFTVSRHRGGDDREPSAPSKGTKADP